MRGPLVLGLTVCKVAMCDAGEGAILRPGSLTWKGGLGRGAHQLKLRPIALEKAHTHTHTHTLAARNATLPGQEGLRPGVDVFGVFS